MSLQVSPLPASSIPISSIPNFETNAPDLPCPIIRRESIRWTGGAGGMPLSIELVFENPAHRPSRKVIAHLEVAAFGAHLPWKPLTRVQVPPVPPWGRVRVGAAGAASALASLVSLIGPGGPGGLPPAGKDQGLRDFFPLGSSPHFVGNLNVYVTRSQPVERHVGHLVGLRPGCSNLAYFMVGDGRRDRYSFSVGSSDTGWALRLQGVEWDSPVEINHAMIPLCIQPPSRAQSGRVSVLVHRGSTGQKVPVEFCLEARAPGPKCYSFPG
jgi:hypothetical protein